MELTFSSHAAEQMIKRQLSRGAIEAVITSPERTEVKEFEIVYDGISEGRRLCVVVARATNPPHIVTTYPRRR